MDNINKYIIYDDNIQQNCNSYRIILLQKITKRPDLPSILTLLKIKLKQSSTITIETIFTFIEALFIVQQ